MFQDPSLGAVQSASALVIVLGLFLGILCLALPRRYALLPIVLVICFVPVGGKLNIVGMNFSMMRLVCTFGVIRVFGRGEYHRVKWARMDSILLVWAILRVLAFVLLWQSVDSVVNAVGYASDAFGLYIIFRCLLRDRQDIERLFKVFALAMVPLALAMCLEKATLRDPFVFFGGVPEVPEIRNGVIRAQGPFGHPILAGTFGAVWIPLFIGLWLQGKGRRLLALVGIAACLVIVAMSGSSGPIGATLFSFVALAMWCIRTQMRLVRWGIVCALIALHMVMHDPVWFIFARVDFLSGSTGWHRANLIDRCIKNFGDWWLLGTKNVQNWGVWAGDTTNQFIVEGVRGGITVFILFICVFVAAFSGVGLGVKKARSETRRVQLFLWAIGSGLLAHLMSYMSVSYFDQNVANWYLILALTAGAATYSKGQGGVWAKAVSAPEPRHDARPMPGELVPVASSSASYQALQ